MPKPSSRATEKNRRASPEAVAKRRAARQFNEVVLGPTPRPNDGRTERRRRRLLQELSEGATRSGHDLKPIDLLLRAQALLDLGEPIAALVAVRPPPPPVATTGELVEGVRKLHAAYSFAPEVYRFAGIDDGALLLAGVLRRKRGPVKAVARSAPGTARRGAA